MKRITCIILTLLLSGTFFAQSSTNDRGTYKFKLGILYINSPEGKRFKEGIREAIDQYPRENQNHFETYDYPYDSETDGLKTLVSLMEYDKNKKGEERKVDIILGPTESGVFAGALEQRKKLEKSGIPVISSQVTAKIPYQKGGWFFRTNINVERRAQMIFDFLNKYWVSSIAILYEDTEFGRRAEEAFRKELQEKQKELYLPLPYDSNDKARSQIRKILQQRPEAVGIFGTRNDFADFYGLLRKLNAGSNHYNPLTFSIIDNRIVQGHLQDNDCVYFVSVTDVIKEEDLDDVKALAYDTTTLILKQLDTLAKSKNFNYDEPSWRESFRNRFEAILNGNIEVRQDLSKTGISFKNHENDTTPKVFKLSNKEIEALELVDTVTLYGKVKQKINLFLNRFGVLPIINIFLIIIIAGFMSIKDIRRWYTGNPFRLFISLHFLLFLLANITVALAVYFYLGETGNIPYNSVIPALVLSMTPSTILGITLFETSTGKSIGLAKLYDSFLQWIHEKLTVKNYLNHQRYINVIAYHNSVYGMKRLLKGIYQNSPNKEQRIRMQTRIEEVLKDAESWLDRRKALARLLFQKLKWQELAERNFIPDKLKSCKPKTWINHPTDPEEAALEAARCCTHSPLKRFFIDEKINAGLKQLSPERKHELENDHKNDLNEMKTPTAIMRNKITFLFLLQGYDPDFRSNICCSGECEKILNDAVEYCKNKEELITRVNEKVNKITGKLLNEEKEGKKKRQRKEYEEIFKEELGELEDLKNNDTLLKKNIGFIFAFNNWNIDYLKANGLLSEDYSKQEKTPEGKKEGLTLKLFKTIWGKIFPQRHQHA
jgi:ABC-type sugar transport system substrate-binding protein